MLRLSVGVILGIGCGLAGCHVVFSSDGTKQQTIDANADARGDANGDANGAKPNIAFITGMDFDGNLGGISGANAKCMVAAQSASLDGDFVAILGVAGGSYNVFGQLQSSRGWVRTDRAFVAYESADFTNSGLRNAIVLDENGNRAKAPSIWTGLNISGIPTMPDCGSFAMTSGVGGIGDTSSLIQLLRVGDKDCSTKHRLLCVSFGNQAEVSPLQPSGKRIFLSKTKLLGGASVAIFDSTCKSEGQIISPGSNFTALVSNQSFSALNRPAIAIPPTTVFSRIDGTPVGPLNVAPSTFLNQYADGMFPPAGTDVQVWTGGMPNQTSDTSENCSNWSTGGNATGRIGSATNASLAAYTFNGGQDCATPRHVYCVEQ